MPQIEHVVVLMFENRSFDNLLGRLYPKCPEFDGLSGEETNTWHRPDGTAETIAVWNHSGMRPDEARIPDPDPGETFADIQEQMFGSAGGRGGTPSMSGFVDNYMRQRRDQPPQPRAVMHYFVPGQVPVISALARQFGVSDRWFAPAPCQTWPNRFFLHAGTAGGRVDNMAWPPPAMPTIFTRLASRGRSWRVYFHDLPQTAILSDLWTSIPGNFRLFQTDFLADARDGHLPHYSFIEPRYFPSRVLGLVPNDEHPPHNITFGEQLIAETYNALRAGPGWERTLLIITHDEHGGCYDHVPPPRAVPPGGPHPPEFAFDRFGPRVPAVIVSPWIPPGSIIRPAPRQGDDYPFDHTSILSTLHRLFDLGAPLTPRVAAAPDLLPALSLHAPVNSGPDRLAACPLLASRRDAHALARRPRNAHQYGMHHPVARIPAILARGLAHGHSLGRRVRGAPPARQG